MSVKSVEKRTGREEGGYKYILVGGAMDYDESDGDVGLKWSDVQSLPVPQIAEKADQIFDAARQTVNDAVGVAQGVVNQAIDAAKGTVIGDIDTVQDVAKFGVQTGRGIIELGEDYVLRLLNASGN
ncbi:uncharacterized protein LOC106642347 [Copidosoma floridanum]|uniref:uncharacterized protein LOC106642347 n=1 Tax=Copidosoma floridanum TaxID=29053 RepID=UPI0006C98D56|nr:uncharacterized protein LOC106642347 [Copidosoma floridanum]